MKVSADACLALRAALAGAIAAHKYGLDDEAARLTARRLTVD
jgi:hypothetical protein